MPSLIDQAQAALQAGQKPQAQTLLAQALKANPREEQAWLLLEHCVDPLERKKYCLQQALLINPNSAQARHRLAELEPTAPLTPPTPPPPPPSVHVAPPAASSNYFDSLAEPEETLDPLEADSPPAATNLEAALMDNASFKPSAFAFSKNEVQAETDDWQAELISPANELEPLEPGPATETIEPSLEESQTDSAPLQPPLDKAAIRAKLEQGVALIERGNKFEGVPILEAVVAADPKNETAWLWLGASADDDHRKRQCFLKALSINPRNKLARDLLKPIEARLGVEATAEAVVAETPAPPAAPASRNGWIVVGFVVIIVIVIAGFLVYWFLTSY